MRIQLISDLHFEFDADRGESFARSVEVAGEVLVLAGDVLPLLSEEQVGQAFDWFCARFEHVIFVLGNHEYYHSNPTDAEALLARVAKPRANLHVLDPGLVEIDGVRILGAALWFPPTPDEIHYRLHLSDFLVIEGFVPWVHDTHAQHLAFLKANIRPGDIVVTHHLPHPQSSDAQWEGSPLNRFFIAEDAVELVEQCGARLWMHGHTHLPCDYVVGKTRVLCNPRGYPGEEKPPVDLALAIELGT